MHEWEDRYSRILGGEAQFLWRVIWRYLTQLYMHLPFNLATSLVGIFPKICRHKYEPTYAYKVVRGGIISNKRLEIIPMAMGEQLNKL